MDIKRPLQPKLRPVAQPAVRPSGWHWDWRWPSGWRLNGHKKAVRIMLAVLVALVTVRLVAPTKPAEAANITVTSGVSTTAGSHDSDAPAVVFTTDQTGYLFYRASGGTCVYKKSTDGGSTWGSEVTVDSSATCTHIWVWWDRWTPSDTTGTFIHIVTTFGNNGATGGNLNYVALNTASDTMSTIANITSTKTNSFNSNSSYGNVTKATDGSLWVGVADAGTTGDQSYIERCASSCTTGTNWVDTSVTFAISPVAHDDVVVMPLSTSGDVVALYWDQTNSKIYYQKYTGGAWSGTMTDIGMTNVQDNSTYDGQLGAIVDRSGNIYISYPGDDATIGGANDDVHTYQFNGTTWTAKTDCITNDASRGLTNTKLAYDADTDTIYCLYTMQTTPNTATTGNIYYKTSTDGAVTWGSESAAVNTAADDIRGASANIMSNDRLYVTWYGLDGANPDKQYGQMVQNLTSTIDSTTRTTTGGNTNNMMTTVFTTDTTGYEFYRDANGACVYSKTTDGGTTWGTAVQIATGPGTSCGKVGVWYDQWTPGDNTGTIIHVLTQDIDSVTTANDDMFYTKLDTSNDTKTEVNITNSSSGAPNKCNIFVSSSSLPYITKSTNGTLFVGVNDATTADSNSCAGSSYVLKCASSCTTGSNWSDTTSSVTGGTDLITDGFLKNVENDEIVLMPLSGGDVLGIYYDTTGNGMYSRVYHSGTGLWDAAASQLQPFAGGTLVDDNTFDGQIGAFPDKQSGSIYFSDVNLESTGLTSTQDDDVKTAVYSGGSWTTKTNCVTNSAHALTDSKLAYDMNTDTIYCIYTGESTAGTSTTNDIYWKSSTDDMTTWSAEHGPIDPTAGLILHASANMMSTTRLYLAYYYDAASNAAPFYGKTLVNLSAPTYTQSGVRAFANADSTSAGSAVTTQNTATSLTSLGAGNFRLRFLLYVNGDGARTNLDSFKLQFAGMGAGSCASPSGAPSAYTDVPAATSTNGDFFRYYDNATPTDGAAVTATGDLTNDLDSIVLETYAESNSFTIGTALLGGNDGKWDVSLSDVGAPTGTTYCFRVVKADGTALTYTNYAQVTTAVPTQDQYMRGGVWFSQNAKRPLGWAQ